ncbi:MAG: four helix bundle protein [Planctomycetota bacterium]|jgi:four helix bundle protein
MSEPATTFVDLLVWQKAHQFVLKVYGATSVFPKAELYGLVSQFRRAAVSIPANIAEGFKRKSRTEKIRFLNISQSSLEESRYFLILSKDLGYLNNPELFGLIAEVSKLLHAYSKAIENSNK